jgi:hypothetical protein
MNEMNDKSMFYLDTSDLSYAKRMLSKASFLISHFLLHIEFY